MKFDLTRPCSNCPFSAAAGAVRGLHPQRAIDIANSLERSTFACHKTTGADGRRLKDRQHCAGAILSQLASGGRQGDMLQLAERLGLYDPARMDRTAPVLTLPQFIQANDGDPAKLTWKTEPTDGPSRRRRPRPRAGGRPASPARQRRPAGDADRR